MTRAIVCALAGALAACSGVQRAQPRSAQWRLQNALPGAYLHLPPMPSPSAASKIDVLPLQLEAVLRHGTRVEVRWDAPDATSAVVFFASDDSGFHKLLSTREASAVFEPPRRHGTVRIAVSDGKRWSYADTRI